MLDLSSIMTDELYEVKLLDGTELKLNRPTQSMVEHTLYIQTLADEDRQVEVVQATTDLFTRILNRNTDGIKFERAQLADEYDFQLIGFVIKDYFGFWNKEIEDKVNFQANL